MTIDSISGASDMKANKPEGAPDALRDADDRDGDEHRRGAPAAGPAARPAPGGSGSGSGSGDGGARVQANVSSLAQALGTDADSLLERLRSGADLASLLGGASTTAAGYGSSATSASAFVSGGLAVDRYA